MAYDNPIPGYHTNNTINLRLWAAKPDREFDLEAFNTGDYVQVRPVPGQLLGPWKEDICKMCILPPLAASADGCQAVKGALKPHDDFTQPLLLL